MNTATPSAFRDIVRLLLVFVASALCVYAQAPATGTIEGRVVNSRTGEYVESARLRVEGTALETFTDSTGTYRLTQVPAGSARVTAFFTGLPSLTSTVTVTAGGVAQHDIALSSAPARPDGSIVKLDEFRVATSREMDGAALAINEQRFSSSIKNVVSTEEFGNVAEGNAAEFIKFLPGVTIDYTGGNARDISINGVPSDFVPVTVDGFSVATAATGGTSSRAVQSDMISINNLSRIEVSYSPTPESQGSALAGSVNMVPRSAFERARPVFNASVYLLMRDNARDFHKVPGPKPSATRNVHPGFDFAYVAPVNKRFGYTLSGGISTNYSPQDNAQTTWRGANSATNGVAFPNTTPDKPYLSQYLIQDAPKVTTRRSAGASIDYRLSQNDRLTFGFQYSSFDGRFLVSNVTFNTVRVLPGDFTAFSTRGAAGAGTLTSAHQERNRFNRTFMPTLIWRHEGPIWKADVGLGHSQQSDYNRDTDQGYFRVVTAQRTGVTIAFDDIFYLRPNRITVTDGVTGAPVDPYNLDTYRITTATRQADRTYDRQRTAYGNLRRDFYTTVPFTLKAGFDLRESMRDYRGGTITYNYLGNGGQTNATPFFDPIYSQRILPYGFPQLQTISNRKFYEHFAANPAQFSVNDNTVYRNQVAGSRISKETVSAVYLRGDVSFLDRRLKLVGGLRAEQTNVKAAGPRNDPTLNYRRDASGQILRNANGTPVLILPTSDALGVSRLTYLDRGTRTEKEYLRLFPSLNASYTFSEDWVARAAYFQSVGRPNFSFYTGGITLPDTSLPPGNNNRIVVNNAAIKAWQSETFSVRLERYFQGVGQISIGAFRRQIDDFFGSTVFNATPAFLGLYDLDVSLYDPFDVVTQQNLQGAVRMQGIDFSYKQALSFLPRWARGVQVFANASAQRLLGDETASLAGFISRSGSWGASLTREKWNARVNWNYRGRQRNSPVTGQGIESGTFNYSAKRLYIDVLGEYYFWKRVGLFVNLRNVGDATEDTEIRGPNTPEHAQFRQRIDYASLWTIGIKGTW
ncbi:MAG: carboxypeptidase regulatory-like domain-containing protein [Opitutaceae bacterium]|nr:carboxypeptidase regulatory-like domain-containing protein [Opitutaceae bacterium]